MKKLIVVVFATLTACMPAEEAARVTLDEAEREALDEGDRLARTGPCAKEYAEADAARSWVDYCLRQQEQACSVDSGGSLSTDIDASEVLAKSSLLGCEEWTSRVQEASQAYFQKKAAADACRDRQ